MTEALLEWHRRRPKLATFIHAPICIALLGTALIAQYAFGQHPCELCLWQRVPYAVILVIAAVSLLKANKWTPWILVLLAALYAVETGIAIHHVGVERHWWHSAAGCGLQATAKDIVEMYRNITQAPVVACDQPTWMLLGYSMATWNALTAAALTALSLAQAYVQRVWWTTKR